VLGGSIHNGSLFPFKKLSTLQLKAISHSPNTRASTFSNAPHKTPSTGPLLVISQHGLTFLQSVNLQTQMRTQPPRSLGTNSHPCNQEASKHTCFSPNFPILTQVFQPKGVRSQTHPRLHSAISKHRLTANQ
jgi:hypothetical protein